MGGYTVTVQDFPTKVSVRTGNSTITIVNSSSIITNTSSNFVTMSGNDTILQEGAADTFRIFTCSAGGNVTGYTQKVDNLGCAVEDYNNFQPGNIAIIERGICLFAEKALLAQQAGALAAIVYNDFARQVIFAGTFDSEIALNIIIPGLGVSYDTGIQLLNQTLEMDFQLERLVGAVTQNIIAETEWGNPDQIIVVGAHLDSVPEGPGINDNGSAVAVVLELALQISKLQLQYKNKIRFAFWGAEEIGLQGSRHYLFEILRTKGAVEVNKMKLYLNLEMLASANFVRAIYPAMSTNVESILVETEVSQTFKDYFDAVNIIADIAPFIVVPDLRARSDHANFQNVNFQIPSGGVISGGDIVKIPAFVDQFGGTAGIWMAPCYHMLCDDYDNARKDVMHELGDSYAHVLTVYANYDTIGVPTARRQSLSSYNQHSINQRWAIPDDMEPLTGEVDPAL